MIEAKLTGDVGAVKAIGKELDRRIPEISKASALEAEKNIRDEVARFSKSGRLARSFDAKIDKSGARVTSDLPYAQIQDQGGRVHAHLARQLAVPIGSAGPIRQRFGELFPIKNGRILAQRTASGLRPLYRLTDSVRIEPKRYLERAGNETKKDAEVIGRQQVQRAIDAGIK